MSRAVDSLRARLLLSGIAAMLLAAGAVTAILGTAFERAVVDAFDRRLMDDLVTLAGRVTSDAGGAVRLRSEPGDTRYSRAFSGHYWLVRRGIQEIRSRSLWDANLPAETDAGEGTPGQAVAFRNIEGPIGQTVRSALQAVSIPSVDGPVYLMVASDVSETLDTIVRFRVLAALAGALVAAALMLGVFVQASYGLRPLRRIRQALETLRRGQKQPLDGKLFPSEIRPLADELNKVLLHQERMIERARTGAGDLAHALKTPLSILLSAAERNDQDLRGLVMEQVQRMRTSIDRHLSVSTPADSQARANVADVALSLQRMFSQLYRERSLELAVSVDPGLCFHGSQEDLEDMLGNLMDNACKWARQNIEVHAEMLQDGTLGIAVTDDGPGIDDEEIEHAVTRGGRLDEKVPGNGLGLSIVSALVTSYGGKLSLNRLPGAGFRAALRLPGSQES